MAYFKNQWLNIGISVFMEKHRTNNNVEACNKRWAKLIWPNPNICVPSSTQETRTRRVLRRTVWVETAKYSFTQKTFENNNKLWWKDQRSLVHNRWSSKMSHKYRQYETHNYWSMEKIGRPQYFFRRNIIPIYLKSFHYIQLLYYGNKIHRERRP